MSFGVSRGKTGTLLVHAKPWVGPPEGRNSTPCTLGRLQTLQLNLPAMIDNETAGVATTQNVVQNLQQQLATVQNQSVNFNQVAEKNANIRELEGHLTTQSRKLTTLQNEVARDSAKLAELPDIITQVQGFVGTEVQFRIYYVEDKQSITVAQSDDYDSENGSDAKPDEFHSDLDRQYRLLQGQGDADRRRRSSGHAGKDRRIRRQASTTATAGNALHDDQRLVKEWLEEHRRQGGSTDAKKK